MKQPTRLNYNSSAASLLAVAGLMAMGVAPIWATTSISANFTAYTLGGLATQDSWAQVTSATNTVNPIQVIAATSSAPQSIKVKGVTNAAVAYRDLSPAFNPVGVTSTAKFYYVIENFRVLQALNSTTGTGSGVCALTTTAGGTGTYLTRLFVRRFQGTTANTTTFDLGLNPAGAGVVYGATALAINTSYKIVVEYTANPTPTLDVVKVYVDPVGLDATAWTAEISQTIATDPTASAKSFVWTPGAVSNSTVNEFTASRLMVGDTLSELLAPAAPVSAAATNINPSGFTANWATSEGATGYYLDVATDSAFTTFVAGYNNLDVLNVATHVVAGTFSPSQLLYYRVRAKNSLATSTSSSTQTVTITPATAIVYTNSSVVGTTDWTTVGATAWDVVPVSDEKSTAKFLGALTGNLTATNADPYTLNALSINSTGSSTLALEGAALTFVTNSATTPSATTPKITLANGTGSTANIANPLVLNNNLSLSKSSTSTGTNTISSVISGTGSLSKTSSGSVTLSGASSYSGGLKINDGEIISNTIGNAVANSPLGTNATLLLGSTTTSGSLKWGEGVSAVTEVSDKGITLSGTTGGGTLNIRGANALTITGPIDTGSNASARNLVLTGNASSSTYALTLNGVISGNGKMRINGSGTRSIAITNENNSFTGGVTLDGNNSGEYKTYVTKIGKINATSPLGTNGTINIGTSAPEPSRVPFNFLVWTNSSNETTDKIINLSGTTNGALINNKGTALLKFTSNVTVTGNGIKSLYADQDDASGTTEFAGSIPDSAAGATLLNKNGLGTLVLSAANTFSGGVTLKGGTLQLGHASALSSGNVLSFTSNGVGSGVLKLAYTGNGPALGNLQLLDNAKIDLGSISGSSVTFATANTWTAGKKLTVANSGTGNLYILDGTGLDLAAIVKDGDATATAARDSVTGLISFSGSSSPFETWVSGYGLSGASALATADPDSDSLTNLQEFVLGGNPTVSSSSVIPAIADLASSMTLTFTRSDASQESPAVTVKVQVSADLASWTDEMTIGATSGSGSNGSSYTVAENGSAADTIVATVLKASATKKFMRVVVSQ
jgi:autotransporter-associated beta strand protein